MTSGSPARSLIAGQALTEGLVRDAVAALNRNKVAPVDGAFVVLSVEPVPLSHTSRTDEQLDFERKYRKKYGKDGQIVAWVPCTVGEEGAE